VYVGLPCLLVGARWGEEWGEWEGERREKVTIHENESVRVGGLA